MLNKIMMTGRIVTDLTVVTEDNYNYCKFNIAVEQSKRNDTETVEIDTFTCLAFNDNAKSVNFLYSKGGQITFVGSLRKTPDNTVVIIVEELHFKNKFAVKVDTNSSQKCNSTGLLL